MAAQREIEHATSENSNIDEETMDGEKPGNKATSLFIVIVSLLFVAIFGGALVGGVVSGNPTNGFFITIIVASVIAISVAIGVSFRYFVTSHAESDDEYLSKNMRGTFSNSDEENHVEEYLEVRHNRNRSQYQFNDCHHRSRSSVESRIKEIQAKSVFGEMSALSPQTYDEESFSTMRQQIEDHHDGGRQGLFDFSSVASSKRGSKVKMREDPPEGAGSTTFEAAWIARGQSQDPSAPKFSTDGEKIIDKECGSHDQINIDQNDIDSTTLVKSTNSENDSDYKKDLEDISTDNEEESSTSQSTRYRREPHRSRSRSQSKSKSPSASRGTESVPTPLSLSKRKLKLQKTQNVGPPSITKPEGSSSKAAAALVTLATPAASETNSLASSFFKPLNGILRKSKKSQSEAGASDINNTNQSSIKLKDSIVTDKASFANNSKGRPPMIPPSRKGGDKNESNNMASKNHHSLSNVHGYNGLPPSTPAKNSTFSIPPPRLIPQTPNGSEIFSEFQSVAGSAYSNGVASSTFDPKAHERALQKMQKIQAPLGANPVGENTMPEYYEDDDKYSTIAPSDNLQSGALAYDVFAPPGAIGIVVDTTEKGCIVHSLKKSSPMQGLINRGDLIIALDDFDVRNMSAASLTKLMAKKSKQSERKFTLVPSDDS